MYEGIKPPEGYYLRDINGAVLCRRGGGKIVAALHEEYDSLAGMPRYVIKFGRWNGIPEQTFYDYDLNNLFIVACAYDRLTGGAK